MSETANIATPVKVTDATFQSAVIDQPLPVLVDFWAEWCGPCRQIAPALEKLASEFAGQVLIAKVNIDENPGLQETFRVMSIPNLMMIKNRTMVFNQPGALPEPVMRDLLKQLIALDVPLPDGEGDESDESARAEASGEAASASADAPDASAPANAAQAKTDKKSAATGGSAGAENNPAQPATKKTAAPKAEQSKTDPVAE